jgi:hypothetical protein
MKREHLNELFLDLANVLGNLLCLYCLSCLGSNFTVYLLAPFNMTVMFLLYFVCRTTFGMLLEFDFTCFSPPFLLVFWW